MYTLLFPTPFLIVGGAQQQLLTLVRGLDTSRFRPIVAPMYPGGALEEEFRAIPGVEILSLERAGKYDVSTLWRIGRLMRERHVDLVHPYVSPATFFGLIPAYLSRGVVTVVSERGGSRRTYHGGAGVYVRIEGWLSRFADAAVANSEAGRALLRGQGVPDRKIRIICNGVDRRRLEVDRAQVAAHRRRLGVPEGGRVVGILATLTPAKDHATFLRAARTIADHDPRVRFAIVGDGPCRSDLERLTQALGLADRVVFFGNQQRVADYLAACDVLVSSSRDKEGHSNSILEAMFLAVPVVATDVGGTRELVQGVDTGRLVRIGDNAAIARAVLDLLMNPGQIATVATRARQLVERQFAPERMVAEYEALYEHLLASSRRGARARRQDDARPPAGARPAVE